MTLKKLYNNERFNERYELIMIKVAPSLLAADFSNLREELKAIETADYLHLDIMDGHFVPNLSMGPGVVKALRPHSELVFDVHLMITNPLKYIDAFIKAGADIITVHVEAEDDTKEALELIKNAGIKCGIVLSPDTPVEAAVPYLDMVDMVLIMSVYPGFGGQKFIERVLSKATALKEMRGERDYEIEIDGGITAENAPLAIEAGVDVLVAGTSVFGAKDRKTAISDIRNKK